MVDQCLTQSLCNNCSHFMGDQFYVLTSVAPSAENCREPLSQREILCFIKDNFIRPQYLFSNYIQEQCGGSAVVLEGGRGFVKPPTM